MSTVGLTPSEFLVRVRVREGLCLLRTTTASVEDVARLVGYQSSNKFYGRVHGYTGLRPSQVRELDGPAFEHMLDECIPLWVQQARRAAVAVLIPCSRLTQRDFAPIATYSGTAQAMPSSSR
jgi:AraC-like DNA-binding protein